MQLVTKLSTLLSNLFNFITIILPSPNTPWIYLNYIVILSVYLDSLAASLSNMFINSDDILIPGLTCVLFLYVFFGSHIHIVPIRGSYSSHLVPIHIHLVHILFWCQRSFIMGGFHWAVCFVFILIFCFSLWLFNSTHLLFFFWVFSGRFLFSCNYGNIVFTLEIFLEHFRAISLLFWSFSIKRVWNLSCNSVGCLTMDNNCVVGRSYWWLKCEGHVSNAIWTTTWG